MSRPDNLTDWAVYVQTLAGAALWSQTVAANTHSFARTLVEEGATMGDVEQILLLFVRQLRATGTRVPGGGPFALVTMALVDEQARKGTRFSPEEVAFMESQQETPDGDDLDTFDLDAALQED